MGRAGIVAVSLAVAATACSGDLVTSSPLGPTEIPAPALNILSLAPGTPPVAGTVTFFATKGRRSVGRVYLENGQGGSEHRREDDDGDTRGREYLRLTIDRNSLLARPDGTPIADGDSVLITIRVADPARILFELDPAGLMFHPDAPAELRIRYDVAGEDLDHDGRHTSRDDGLPDHLAIWRQADLNAAFVRLPSQVSRSERNGFSRYEIAY